MLRLLEDVLTSAASEGVLGKIEACCKLLHDFRWIIIIIISTCYQGCPLQLSQRNTMTVVGLYVAKSF